MLERLKSTHNYSGGPAARRGFCLSRKMSLFCIMVGRDDGKRSIGFVGCTKIIQSFSNASQKKDESAH